MYLIMLLQDFYGKKTIFIVMKADQENITFEITSLNYLFEIEKFLLKLLGRPTHKHLVTVSVGDVTEMCETQIKYSALSQDKSSMQMPPSWQSSVPQEYSRGDVSGFDQLICPQAVMKCCKDEG